MSKNWNWKVTGTSKDKKFAYSNNPGQNVQNKTQYSSKTEQEKKSLVFIFACFLAAIGKV